MLNFETNFPNDAIFSRNNMIKIFMNTPRIAIFYRKYADISGINLTKNITKRLNSRDMVAGNVAHICHL